MRWLAVLPALLAAVVAMRADAAAPRAAFVASSYGKVVLLSGGGAALRSFGLGESPAFSADGQRVAFVRDGDVWTIGVDGTGLRRVTRTAAREESPDFSPDGRLVWSDGHALWVDGRRLTAPPEAWQEDRSPAWSPDGRFVAFASNRPSAFNQELYLVRPDGTGLHRLTFTPGSADVLGDDGMPAWRPDGRSLVFVSNRDRNFELYRLDLASLEETRLTDTPQDESLPRVSRTGRYAFVVLLPEGRSRISIASAELRGRRVLQAGSAVDWSPASR